MPTSPTLIDALPDAPSRDMTDEEFVEAADTWVAAQPTLRTQINSVATTTYNNAVEAHEDAVAAAASEVAAEAAKTAALGVSDYIATSASSLTMAAGSKTIVLEEAGKAFAATEQIALSYRGDPEIKLFATIDSVSGQTITATVAADGVVGSGGPYDDWLVISGELMQSGATVDEIWEMATAYAAVTPKVMQDALAEVTLTVSGTTIITTGDAAPDHEKFINAAITLAGNYTLPNLLNPKVGRTGRIRIIQDGTGGRTLSVGSNWDRAGGTTSLSTAAGAVDILEYEVISTTQILYDILRAPT